MRQIFIIFCIFGISLFGCGGDSNQPPVADAGPNHMQLLGENTFLDAGRSFDVDGVIVSYRWDQIEGSPVNLLNYSEVNPSFYAPSVRDTLIFELTVTDNEGAKAKDTVMITVSGTPGPQSVIALNDTGVTFAYEQNIGIDFNCIGVTSGEQDCSHGRDAVFQNVSDGDFGFSFTKLDASGRDLSVDESVWHCVRDNVTGLIWEVKTDDNGIHDKDKTYRWGGLGANLHGSEFHNDWNPLVNGANEEALCGVTGWRVPTIKELESLVHFGRPRLTIDALFFPNTRPQIYWSTTASAEYISSAWVVSFYRGWTSLEYRSFELAHVRLVLGPVNTN